MTREQLAELAKQHNCKLAPAQGDYIPPNSIKVSADFVDTFTQAPVPEFARCGRQVAHDIQSGPIYCGEWATMAAESPCKQHYCLWCDKHIPHKFRKARETQTA